MKKIVLQPGVVLVDVCDEYLLVATREAREVVPYVQHINEAAAFYWRLLEEGKTPPEMAKAAAAKYHMQPKQAIAAVQMFLKQMHQRKYIELVEVNEQ